MRKAGKLKPITQNLGNLQVEFTNPEHANQGVGKESLRKKGLRSKPSPEHYAQEF